ncbi:MAG: SRPBCC family protein [Gammaproteobacteria bacterium]|nr:SRPBCC family protein [Gammaproteobacteria bacterium]
MTRKATLQLAAVFGALLMSAPVTAADLRDVVVEREESRYKLRSETYFDADPESLYRVLTDYDHFDKISSTFVEARNIEPDEHGRPRFYTRMEGCVLLFCKSYIRTGHLVLTPVSDIVAIVDPELSNFRFARERWQFIEDGDGTLLIYTFEMEPDFWIPPVVGPFVVKRVLRRGGADAVDRIEALAQGREPEL